MSDDLKQRLVRTEVLSPPGEPFTLEAVKPWLKENMAIRKAAVDRIEELEAENKLLNEQLAAIEEHGNETLNALPDCLMRLAPALVENDELKSKLEKAVEALEKVQAFVQDLEPYADQGHTLVPALYYAATTLAELKGETDE